MFLEKAAYGGLVTDVGLRRMQRWGIVVTAAWALTLILWAVLWPEPYAGGWWLVFQLFAVGRTVCAYEGVRLGYSNFYLFLQGGTQDIAGFLLVFPLFVRFYEKVAGGRAIDRILRGLTRAAEKHQKHLQGYGAIGLFLFVFLPVSGTGTLVGSVVGYLLGLRMRMVIPVVITAHLASMLVLLGFFEWLQPLLLSVNEGFAKYFAWILLAAMVILGWLYGQTSAWFAGRRNARGTAPTLREAEATADTE